MNKRMLSNSLPTSSAKKQISHRSVPVSAGVRMRNKRKRKEKECNSFLDGHLTLS